MFDQDHKRSRALSGALLGASVCLRFHYGAALAIATLWQLRRNQNALISVTAWAAGTILLLAGVLDTVTLGLPFQSIWYNLWINLAENASGDFGTSPWYSYGLWVAQSWTVLLWPFAILAAMGAARWPALAMAAILVILSQSIFAHKEYRFIYFTLMTIPIFIGLCAAQLSAYCRRAVDDATISVAQIALIIVLGLASYIAAMAGALADKFVTNRNGFAAFMAAHDLTDMCGLGVKGLHWAENGGGYSYFNRAVPLYYSTGQIGPYTDYSRRQADRSVCLRRLQVAGRVRKRRLHEPYGSLQLSHPAGRPSRNRLPGSGVLRATKWRLARVPATARRPMYLS